MIGNPHSNETLKSIKLPSGIQLAYREEGNDDEVLVFIHGMGSNRKAWDQNLPALREHYRCLAIDLPNYGASTKGDFTFTMGFFSEVIVEFLGVMGLVNPVLVGHSLGGQAVLRTLVDRPDLSSRAIVVAPAGLETFSQEEIAWLDNYYNPETIAGFSSEQVRRNVEINFHRFPENAEFMVKDDLALRKAPHFPQHCKMIPRSVLGMVTDAVNAHLSEIQARVLILFGKNDQLIPHPILHAKEKTEVMAIRESLKIPGVHLVLVEECGHFLQWERADRFNQEVLDFLKVN